MKKTISIRLFKTLLKAKALLSEEAQKRMADFVLSQRMEDGSFMNKNGQSDLYYTAFGWMLSYVLDIPSDRRRMDMYLSRQETKEMDLIHYAAFMRCRMIRLLMDSGGRVKWLFRSFSATEIKPLEDFTGVPHNDIHSPYTQFIWLSLLEDTGNRIKDKKEVLHLLESYQAVAGGYMNSTDGITATTNATVAALAIKGQFEGYNDNTDIHFLYNLQAPSGGFAATQASPLPDLLSTATALFMLSCYGVKPKYVAKDFIEAHWLDSGGFSATLMDETSDVEYAFYGLLALGTDGDFN
ncbi:hypothetical protein M2137_002846 [Parabacteroides sp. PFB2-10]|uniref:prenyltransferase/squalene oxidase repeat-containing protein n=1 Tax=Parabacteroides sp. PFB2-10 TaxID=1742405 RepID=UPI0024730A70|nr:prenyltransferase/squalene oxidase repeat-containing protein [Parabacteroides sp. PFB2-10]MDH6314052.1 hypothetical protein [Parabacteroides sp. PFB2-10]